MGTWCSYCQLLQPDLDALYRKYQGSGLAVLGISIRESLDADPEKTLKALGVSFKTAVNGDNIAKNLMCQARQLLLFIDRKGELIWKTHSTNALSAEFEAYIRLILYLD